MTTSRTSLRITKSPKRRCNASLHNRMRIIGLDPGLQHTGWGIIDQDGSRLSFVAAGRISSVATRPLAERLVEIYAGLTAVIDAHQPDTAAVEETFVNKNPTSTLKLGLARGVV